MTQLTVYGDASIALSDLDAELALERQAEINAYHYMPTKYTLMTGGTPGFVNKATQDTVKSLTGIVLISQAKNAFFEDKTIDEGRLPLCSSPDGVRGRLLADLTAGRADLAMRARVPHPGIAAFVNGRGTQEFYDCAKCPLNLFGSAFQDPENTGGKACKNLYWLLFMPEGNSRPVIVSLSPMSLKPWNVYCSTLEDGNPRHLYFGAVTRLETEPKSNGRYKFSTVKPTFQGWLSESDLAAVVAIRRQYADHVRQATVQATEAFSDEVNGNRTVDQETGEIIDSVAAESIPF